MLFHRLHYLFVLPLIACGTVTACQPVGAPLTSHPLPSPASSNPPVPNPLQTDAPHPLPDTAFFPPGFPTENQLLASGKRLGWGIMRNQTDAQGNGAVLWSLGHPAGQRFAQFTATAPISRGSLPEGGSLRWVVDVQGNGLLFENESFASVGNEVPPPSLRIWQVQHFAPGGTPERRQADVLALYADAQGNGWVMLSEVASELSSARIKHLYALQHYQLAEKMRTAETLQQGDVMDADGNGFRVYSTRKEVGDSLWLQMITAFENAGEPVLLADNGGELRVHVSEGEGLIAWLVRDALNRPVERAFRRVQHFLPAESLPTIAAPHQADTLLMAAHLNADGTGLTVWQTHHWPTTNIFPSTPQASLVLRPIRQGQWQPEVVLREGPYTYNQARLATESSGRGLLLWSEVPHQMNTPFVSNQEQRLYSQHLENGLPSGEAQQISEAAQASVDAWSMNLTPEGHGLIAWTQFNAACPGDLGCNLEQTVWARAVYGFRVP